MITPKAELLWKERTINLEIHIAPDTAMFGPIYQDFLDKYQGPVSVDVEVIQEKDENGAVKFPGHALVKMKLQDADDVEIQDVPDEVPASSTPVTSTSSVMAKASGSGAPIVAPASSPVTPSSQIGVKTEEAKPLSALELLNKKLAADKDKGTIKL